MMFHPLAARRQRQMVLAELLASLPAATAARITDATAAASRATRYAIGGVLLSVTGNAVHLATKLTDAVDPGAAFVAAVAAEALFGPALVFICSHLLMHTDEAKRIELVPLWAGFVCGALLSSVHLWALAYSVLATGILADVHEAVPYVAALLLPIGVEGASIGSIQQANRYQHHRDRLIATADQHQQTTTTDHTSAAPVLEPAPVSAPVAPVPSLAAAAVGSPAPAEPTAVTAAPAPVPDATPATAATESEPVPVVRVLPFPEPLAPVHL